MPEKMTWTQLSAIISGFAVTSTVLVYCWERWGEPFLYSIMELCGSDQNFSEIWRKNYEHINNELSLKNIKEFVLKKKYKT